jgi:hypothetical protein
LPDLRDTFPNGADNNSEPTPNNPAPTDKTSELRNNNPEPRDNISAPTDKTSKPVDNNQELLNNYSATMDNATDLMDKNHDSAPRSTEPTYFQKFAPEMSP